MQCYMKIMVLLVRYEFHLNTELNLLNQINNRVKYVTFIGKIAPIGNPLFKFFDTGEPPV